MSCLHLIKAGVAGDPAEKLVQALIKVENHSDLGKPLQGTTTLTLQKLEGGERNPGPFGKFRLAPAAGLAVIPDTLPDLTNQASRIADLKR